jgi:hypothetical protein
MAYTTKQEIFDQSNTWVLDLTRQILAQMECHTHLVKTRTEAKIGAFNDSDAHLAEIAIGMEPEPFGLAHVYQCIPYANPELFRQDFEGAVRRGWLITNAEGSYRATDKGKQYHNYLHRELKNVYGRLHPLPVMQLERLNTLLDEIIAAIADSRMIDYKPAFEMDLRLAPARGSALQKICCKLSHLMAFRDDAYLNAWMGQDINSYVWEAFSLIYKGQAQTAADLAAKLEAQRRYDNTAYAGALAELSARGWISECNGKYEPTVEGLKILAEVARTMTQYFFEPWADMEGTKIDRLKVLMEALLRALKSPQTERWHGHSNTARSFGWRSAQWVRDKVR